MMKNKVFIIPVFLVISFFAFTLPTIKASEYHYGYYEGYFSGADIINKYIKDNQIKNIDQSEIHKFFQLVPNQKNHEDLKDITNYFLSHLSK